VPGCRVHCWCDATTVCARSRVSKVGRVADADAVEDGLTGDVPSSIVDYQKLRGTCSGRKPRPFWEGG